MEKTLIKTTIVLIVSVLLLSSCAPGNEPWDQTENHGHRAGFWAGLWHVICFTIGAPWRPRSHKSM